MSKPCYVYLIEAEPDDRIQIAGSFRDLVKVGISDSPNGRLAQFMTSCPFPIRMVRTWRLPSRQAAQRIERSVHVALRSFRTSGEWFLTSGVGSLTSIQDELESYFISDLGLGIEAAVPHLLCAGIEPRTLIASFLANYGEAPTCLHEATAALQ
jgi:hypothetical protein